MSRAPRNSVKPATDTRLRHDNAPHVRGDLSARQDAERTAPIDDTAELEELLRSEFDQNTLPSPPLMPGFHLVWLTTGSTHDALSKRQRLGYAPVMQSELPDFDPSPSASVSGNQRPDGPIMCQEMILCKVTESRYRMMMHTFHHKRPLEEEAGITSRIEEMAGQKDRAGRGLQVQEEGFLDLQKRVRQGTAADLDFA